MKFDLFLEQCDLAEYHWKESLPDFGFSYLRETFPEARKLMKDMYQREIDDAQESLKLSDERERFIDDLIFRKASKENEEELRMILTAVYVTPLRSEKERLIKRNAFYIASLNGVVPKGGITDEQITRAKEYPISEMVLFKKNIACCIFHKEKTPSLHYYYRENRGYCFSCQKACDAIDVAMEVYGLDFINAVKKLSR